MNDVIALIGNPNSGKTTLFNALTGTYQKTGNWTGVTTAAKEGLYKKDKRIKIVDLPGLYSLDVKSEDERAVINFLKETPPKAVINVVDGTNLERNLFLTLQLVSLKIPTVIAVNMYDELIKNRIRLDVEKFSDLFGVPIVPISAVKSVNLLELMSKAISAKNALKRPETSAKAGLDDGYLLIENIISQIIERKQTKSEFFTLKADAILTHKILGIPIFFAVVALTYFLSMKIGGAIGKVIESIFINFASETKNSFGQVAPSWLTCLICDGIINGVGTVASFLPQILVLFLCMAMLELSGYMSRVAFILDGFFRVFGLSGKSLIPMIVSCGCTVTGLMATRTIEDKSERRMTVFLTPFMPCGAKTAVFGWFSYEFFGGSALIAASMYFLALFSVGVFGFVLKRFKAFRSSNEAFILEMPILRAPRIKDVLLILWEKVKDFVLKAGSVVFLVSVALWLLMNFGFNGYNAGNVEQSFLCFIGNAIKFIFYPLGFGNWQASVSVLSGIFAKEAVVETLRQVSANPETLFYNGFSVYAFMVFVLLSPPCMASIATAKGELVSKKWLLGMLFFQFAAGYAIALTVNIIGFIISSATGLIFLSIAVIILMIILAIMLIKAKGGCAGCAKCLNGERRCHKNKKRSTI